MLVVEGVSAFTRQGLVLHKRSRRAAFAESYSESIYMNQLDRGRVRTVLDQLRGELLDQRTANGHWEGELAGSALSTATAISSMAAVILNAESASAESHPDAVLIQRGMAYLAVQQNADGGFGDTDRSHSNIATSYLVLAASTLAQQARGNSLPSEMITSLKDYLQRSGQIEGLRKRYGTDKTFVVPILCNMAIAGLVDWNEVQALPFEAAVFPQSMYRFLQMPVVSYAIPALVAIGQARHFHGRQALAPMRWIRAASIGKTMRVLRKMQPESGGYLEATPLTSFVVMSLAATGRGDCEVAANGLRFLRDSIRDDGSWPIDTNLATWVTSLSVHALSCDPDDAGEWCTEPLVDWHLSCQHRQRHPFTGADPGGWGWTDLSGAVPDSDDTPGAMLALRRCWRYVDQKRQSEIDRAIEAGKTWLYGLQNRNGGWPTFCRGWGKLPFDRSSTDLTAHAMRALGDAIDPKSRRAAERFLAKQQRDDGAWLPLWFGNQDLPDESNPVYGTSRVMLSRLRDADSMWRAATFLLQNQNADGGWGGGKSVREKIQALPAHLRGDCDDGLISSVEESALAVEALSTFVLILRDLEATSGVTADGAIAKPSENQRLAAGESAQRQQMGHSGESVRAGGKEGVILAIITGVEFLLRSVGDGRHRVPWPIGFYFAKLWYHEQLYPLVFTVAALGKALRATAEKHDCDWPS